MMDNHGLASLAVGWMFEWISENIHRPKIGLVPGVVLSAAVDVVDIGGCFYIRPTREKPGKD
jgi:hypothetical protein